MEAERRNAELEKIVRDEGLAELSDAIATHLRSINEWHDASGILRETPPTHPLHEEAVYQYQAAVDKCANAQAVVTLEEKKAEREWLARQNDKLKRSGAG